MGKTYRTSKLAAAGILPEGRIVKESALRKFGKAFKRFTHHQERRAVAKSLHAAVTEEAL